MKFFIYLFAVFIVQMCVTAIGFKLMTAYPMFVTLVGVTLSWSLCLMAMLDIVDRRWRKERTDAINAEFDKINKTNKYNK